MNENFAAFDHWIRSSFKELNTALEQMYFQQNDRADVSHVGQEEKKQLEQEGRVYINALLNEGNTDEGFQQAFDLLGNVGLYMAACRRHEITEPSRNPRSPLEEASSLALHIAASLGVTPRFATAHLCTHNRAHNGVYKSFTSLEDELLFIDYNNRGILGYKRAADALLRIYPLGISHPLAFDLFKAAKDALNDVYDANARLFAKLDTDRFFYSVRPYYKSHRVGSQVYRGANAGDFAGINVIDMLLGLCSAQNQSYSRILVDKFLYMMPEDQQILRESMRYPNFLDDFLEATSQQESRWYQENLRAFLELCEIHGRTAVQHHNELVEKYIAQPSQSMETKHLKTLTASGPPLEVLMRSLAALRDSRSAVPSAHIPTRYADIELLKATLQAQPDVS